MLDIKVLGPGCANCHKVETLVREIVSEHKIEATIEKVTDRNRFLDYGVMLTPGLWVNGKLLSSGKIPTKSTMEHWLLDAAK
ncbi:MAG: thioredoxin family protein [bacterium]